MNFCCFKRLPAFKLQVSSFKCFIFTIEMHFALTSSEIHFLSLHFLSLHQMTPLHVVTEKLRARFSVVKYLVDKGAGINIKDNRGVST